MSGATAVRRSTRSRRLVGALLSATLAVLGGGGSALASAVALPAAPSVAPAAAAPLAAGSITLDVLSLKDMPAESPTTPATPLRPQAFAGKAIGEDFKWIINADDTGDPGTATNRGTQNCLPETAPGGIGAPKLSASVFDPAGSAGSIAGQTPIHCPWPSVRATNGWAPIVAEGTQADLAHATSLALGGGKYLISVTADGYKIAGAHFTVDGGTTPQAVTVRMLPTPLPLATIKIQVFNDSAPVDATYEADAESGLAGFVASLADSTGRVSTDYFGNPICTIYQHDKATKQLLYGTDGRPLVDPTTNTGRCTSDGQGVITIPNLGEDRYAALVSPPVGQQADWVETTTLEGGHDSDIWVQAGDSGLDSEVTRGAEPVPATQFGFVHTGSTMKAGGAATVSGRVAAQLPYIGGSGGQAGPTEGIAAGAKLGPAIASPWIALSDLNAGDQQVYVGRGNPDGTFSVPNVPDGSYQLTAWDADQDYILNSISITVDNGAPLDVGLVPLTGWFTHVYGTVFNDANGNGKQDPGEAGVPNFKLTVRERDNSLMDQGLNTVTTDDQGHYEIKETYPLGKFLVLEAFDTRYQTTGVTAQGENEPSGTTTLGGFVDYNFLPIIGLGGKVDWGVAPYDQGTNGGIAGTVTYDTTRNELDPKDAVTEAYQPGIPGIKVDLFKPVPCHTHADTACSSDNLYEVTSNGSYAHTTDTPLQTYTTDAWNAPKGCTARMWNGQPLTDQQALPAQGDPNITCTEAPMAGVSLGVGNTTDGSTNVNGNYAFAGLDAGDYVVTVENPTLSAPSQKNKPMFNVTSEADVNVFTGASYVAQEDYAAATHGAVNTAQAPKDTALPPQAPSQQAGIISSCVGALHTVHVTNPDFNAAGGSPFEGQDRPSCSDKLVTVRSGQTVSPNFHLWTDVPIPTHFWGLTLNDLGLSLDKTSVNYGEAQGMPYVPVGLYDDFGNLVDTTHTDYNGLYEALEPSTDTYNCPVPAGPCPGMYRFVGNDPGGPGAPNSDYNPRFRTIAANFQAWPGLFTVTDEAPTQVASTILTPDLSPAGSVACDLPTTTPQLLAVDKPVVNVNGSSAARRVTVTGSNFGPARGSVRLGTTTIASSNVTWTTTSSPNTISFVVPQSATGSAALTVTTSTGVATINGLTLQLVNGNTGRSAAAPKIYDVGPGHLYPTVQAGVDAAQAATHGNTPFGIVVVYPNASTPLTPRQEYNENVIVDGRVKLQGVGPGGFVGTTFVPGSILDGSGFSPDNAQGTAWLNKLATEPTWAGASAVPDAAVVTFLQPRSENAPALSSTWRPSIDGFQVTGGAQSDITQSTNTLTGANTTPYGANGSLITQGGGLYVHAGVQGLQVTDDLVVGNGGAYGGGIRVGTPYVGDNGNYGIVISRNQIRDNGGTNLAGGIGLFAGSNGYSIDHNAICGNHSSEYGGGISAFGWMGNAPETTSRPSGIVLGWQGTGGSAPAGGSIDHNRIWFNQSYDEGGGVMVAGELPANPDALSPGSGPVAIDSNVVQANLANDDGGGIRLLMASGSHTTADLPAVARTRTTPAVAEVPQTLGRITITNDTVAENISAHEGGGISLDDALFVDVVNTTVVKNITTATATTSNGQPAAAGLTTGAVSGPLQAHVDVAFAGTRGQAKTPTNTYLVSNGVTGTSDWLGFSRPTLRNDVFWDNRAGSYAAGTVTGIGAAGDATAVNNWDVQVVDQAAGATAPMTLPIFGSLIQTTTGLVLDPVGTDRVGSADPGFPQVYDVGVFVLAVRANPQFRMAALVTASLPYTLIGDYHLKAVPASAAYGAGSSASYTPVWSATATGALAPHTAATLTYTVQAPALDIDGDARPRNGRNDAGSDQVQP